MTTALAEQPTSTGTVGNKESSKGSRGFLRKQSPEAQARAERFKKVKDALGVARTAFATEVRSATKKTKDSEHASFVAYEGALNDYLTHVMHSQGFTMAEMARIGERDFMGALWRTKNKVKFWGGTGALAVGTGVVRTGVGILAGIVLNKFVYTPVSKAITNTFLDYSTESIMAKRQKEAREASADGTDFKTFTGSENLLDKNLSSRFKKVSSYLRNERRVRLGFSVASGTGVAFLTGGGISSHILHDHMGSESIGDVMSEHVGGNVSRFLTEGITPQVVGALGAVGTFFSGGLAGKAMAAELPAGGGVHPSELPGSVGVTPETAVAEATRIERAFTDAAATIDPNEIHHIRTIGGDPFAESMPETFEKMSEILAWGKAHGWSDAKLQGFMNAQEELQRIIREKGIGSVTQIIPEGTIMDWSGAGRGIINGPSSLDIRGGAPGIVHQWSYTENGVQHYVREYIPFRCFNVGERDVVVPPAEHIISPPPVETVVVPAPPAEVIPPPRPPTEVFLKRDPIVTVCNESGRACDVPTNAYLIFDERGMSLSDAQERVRDLVLGEDRRGTEDILIENYQGNIPPESRFVLMHYTDPATGRTSYWCMNIANNPDGDRAGHFSHPTITTPNGRSIEVRTEVQWQALINGPGNVVNPEDPIIPLVLVDTNNNGIPDGLRVRKEDVPTTGPARQ